MERYEEIISRIQERLPEARINMMAYYPVNETDKLPDEEWANKDCGRFRSKYHLFHILQHVNRSKPSDAAIVDDLIHAVCHQDDF